MDLKKCFIGDSLLVKFQTNSLLKVKLLKLVSLRNQWCLAVKITSPKYQSRRLIMALQFYLQLVVLKEILARRYWTTKKCQSFFVVQPYGKQISNVFHRARQQKSSSTFQLSSIFCQNFLFSGHHFSLSAWTFLNEARSQYPTEFNKFYTKSIQKN